MRCAQYIAAYMRPQRELSALKLVLNLTLVALSISHGNTGDLHVLRSHYDLRAGARVFVGHLLGHTVASSDRVLELEINRQPCCSDRMLEAQLRRKGHVLGSTETMW